MINTSRIISSGMLVPVVGIQVGIGNLRTILLRSIYWKSVQQKTQQGRLVQLCLGQVKWLNMVMVHATRSRMPPALVKAYNFSGQWLIWTCILVEEWHAIDRYADWPQGSWFFGACFSRVEWNLESIGQGIDGIGILYKCFPSKCDTSKIFIQWIGWRIIRTLVVWCSIAFDGNERTVRSDAGGAVYFFVNIGDRR